MKWSHRRASVKDGRASSLSSGADRMNCYVGCAVPAQPLTEAVSALLGLPKGTAWGGRRYRCRSRRRYRHRGGTAAGISARPAAPSQRDVEASRNSLRPARRAPAGARRSSPGASSAFRGAENFSVDRALCAGFPAGFAALAIAVFPSVARATINVLLCHRAVCGAPSVKPIHPQRNARQRGARKEKRARRIVDQPSPKGATCNGFRRRCAPASRGRKRHATTLHHERALMSLGWPRTKRPQTGQGRDRAPSFARSSKSLRTIARDSVI